MTIQHAIKLTEGVDLLARALIGLMKSKHGACSDTGACEIPPPCWYPVPAGELTSYACPRATTTLRIRVVNDGPVPRVIRPQATDGVTVKPAKLTLPPMERGRLTTSFTMPADADLGDEYERVVWIRGCQSHYARWRIVAAEKDLALAHELEVVDRPDYVHHWYDHFYCSHPCMAHGGGAAKP